MAISDIQKYCVVALQILPQSFNIYLPLSWALNQLKQIQFVWIMKNIFESKTAAWLWYGSYGWVVDLQSQWKTPK